MPMDILERLQTPLDPDDPDLWAIDRNRLEAANEIKRLRTQNDELRRWKALDKPLAAAMSVVSADMQRLRAKNAELLAALKPFAAADKTSLIDTLGHISREDIERARTAIAATTRSPPIKMKRGDVPWTGEKED
jgi:hypothetical protein